MKDMFGIELDSAPSALGAIVATNLGRCPRLLHFAPLALKLVKHPQ